MHLYAEDGIKIANFGLSSSLGVGQMPKNFSP
jgi:hypothetical protein